MGAIQLKAVMEAMGRALVEGDAAERAHYHPVDAAADVGDVVIGYPESISFGTTFGRGSDTITLSVWVVAGLLYDDNTQDELDRLMGDGERSVVTILEAGELGGLADVIASLQVTSGAVDPVLMSNGLTYAAARFDCEVLPL